MRVMRSLAAVAVLGAGLAACGSAAPSGAAGPSEMIPAADRGVAFTVDGTMTYGTLDVPAHRAGQRLAAALLLAGSGPTDRDGDDAAAGVEPHTLRLIAGVVSLITPILLSPANAAYVRSDDAVYPPDVAARLPGGLRVLVTDGTGDLNAPPGTITPLVGALAAAGTTGPGLRLLSGVNHFLHPPGASPDDQVLAPSAVAALRVWGQPYALPPDKGAS